MPFPEHVDDAVVLLSPVLETVEELAAGVVVGVQAEGLGGLRLGVLQEGSEVGQVHAGRGDGSPGDPPGASRTPGAG